MKQILIYGDEGVSNRSKIGVYKLMENLFHGVYKIKVVTKEYVNNENWLSDTELFIMPGGYTRPHYKNLKDNGNHMISQFVQDGGKYLGICAGAYYGCAITEFDIGNQLELELKGPLNFFEGTGFGPVYGSGSYYYDSDKGLHASKVSCLKGNGNSTKIYYNGGCSFSNHISKTKTGNVTVLSRFLDVKGNTPAIISCKVGKGMAILSGIHFEMPYNFIDLSTVPNIEIVKMLETAEPERENFAKSVLAQFNMKS